MATTGKKGDSKREGAVRKRKQVYNPKNKRFVKIDEATGQFMDVKADSKPFKGVRGAGKKKKRGGKKKAAKKRGGKKKASKKRGRR